MLSSFFPRSVSSYLRGEFFKRKRKGKDCVCVCLFISRLGRMGSNLVPSSPLQPDLISGENYCDCDNCYYCRIAGSGAT